MIGKQENGTSQSSVKAMTRRAIAATGLTHVDTILDIGGGKGDMAIILSKMADKVILLDAYPAEAFENIVPVACDLNEKFLIPSATADFVVSLEVIEHLENPRHFIREINRVLKPGGFVFISTPHNSNLIARLLFLMRGENRYFQDFSYPAHITALLPIDLKRLTSEAGLRFINFYYNHHDVLPGLKKSFYIKSKHFSNSIGILCQKPL